MPLWITAIVSLAGVLAFGAGVIVRRRQQARCEDWCSEAMGAERW